MRILPSMLLVLCLVLSSFLVAPAADPPWLLPTEARFRPDGQVSMEKMHDDRLGGTRLVQREKGTYNGLSYSF